jgi:ketosteroid isomerase-like protein
MSSEDEVRNASKQFYAALNRMANGDASSLAASWSHGPTVTVMHPIGGRQVGWDAVRVSFEQVAQLAADGQIELKDQLIHVAGDLAYEVGREQGRVTLAGHPIALEYRVTNIYQREAGLWKMIHHHTDTSPTMLDVLSRLQAGSAQAGEQEGG